MNIQKNEEVEERNNNRICFIRFANKMKYFMSSFMIFVKFSFLSHSASLSQNSCKYFHISSMVRFNLSETISPIYKHEN